ncbi:MAG: hypothetical protein ACYTGQ_12845, partial [Planctomycetota bacterium]
MVERVKTLGQRVGVLGRGAGDQRVSRTLQQRLSDGGDLLGRLTRGEDDLGHAATPIARVV